MEIQGPAIGIQLQAAELGREHDELQGLAQGGRNSEAARRFEDYIATTLVKELRRGMKGFFGEGSGAGVYEGWFDQHLGKALGEAGALDLAGMVKAALGRAAEAAEAEASGATQGETP